ncbi:MAG: HU family DNA-binding protein [Endomicrobiia bacterium]|jgi:nucleoid DNA-binding protein|nr:integration host factor subunit beta [Endomicrobiaceae bacterium]MDD3052834.1 integration host factor subunit beta [Endomicrobiaceae bacterium]MDD3921966.1 integration host factor subunit beta [Endomicrobiaceae bacterium]MDD5101853.1 integration host factor subunit beta [Endomicrobiaceae bacterium]
MTKNDLVEKISNVLPSKKEANIVVNALFDEIVSSIKNGEKVVITGFGSFNLITTETKKGRNPKTGESLMIPPMKKIRFKQSKDMFR